MSSVVAMATIVSLAFIIFPEASLAADISSPVSQNHLVFEIKNSEPTDAPTELATNQTAQNSIQMNEIVQNDPLVINLKNYLGDSPLADMSDKLVLYPHWQRALAISFVESQFCRHTPKTITRHGVVESYNCSGIGGDRYKEYGSYEQWFADMNNLLDQPNYINRPIEKFLHYYVVPGSNNWLYGVKKTEADLTALEELSKEQRIALANSQAVATAGNETPQLVTLGAR